MGEDLYVDNGDSATVVEELWTVGWIDTLIDHDQSSQQGRGFYQKNWKGLLDRITAQFRKVFLRSQLCWH